MVGDLVTWVDIPQIWLEIDIFKMFYIKTISRPSESEAYTEPALVLLKAKYKVYSVKMWY